MGRTLYEYEKTFMYAEFYLGLEISWKQLLKPWVTKQGLPSYYEISEYQDDKKS